MVLSPKEQLPTLSLIGQWPDFISRSPAYPARLGHRQSAQVAEGAALMTGSKVAWHAFELGTDNMMPSDSLSLAFGSNLQRLGVTDIEEFCEGRGSSDMGNVSRVVPAIHPYLSIGDGLIAHTAEFAQASQGPQGLQVAVLAAKALAHTAVDLLTDPSILEAARREHRRLLSKESGTL